MRYIVAALLLVLIQYPMFSFADEYTLYCSHWDTGYFSEGGIGCTIWCGEEPFFCETGSWTAVHFDYMCEYNNEPCAGAEEGDRCRPDIECDRY